MGGPGAPGASGRGGPRPRDRPRAGRHRAGLVGSGCGLRPRWLRGAPAGGVGARVVRAFNVLRQYDEAAVEAPWRSLISRLDPSGIVIDGTCDELGRLGGWVTLDADGPQNLTLSWRLRDLDAQRVPSVVAERLPKALIHCNVPGEPIHDLLARVDAAWRRAAPFAGYGVRQRAVAAFTEVATGTAVIGGPERWRLGELTVPWSRVAPLDGPLAQRW